MTCGMSDESPEILHLRKEIGQIRFVMVLLLGVGLLFLTLVNLAAIATIPRFEKIFEEMLGSPAKLPQLTRMIVFYGRLGGGLAPYALMLMVPALAMLGLVLGSRTRVMPILCVLVMAFQAIHWAVLSLSMYLPLIAIIQGVGEKA